MYSDQQIRAWMRNAVDLAKQSVLEDPSTKPYVGAVVVRDGEIIGSGYRGMLGRGTHAEYCVLETLDDAAYVTGSTVFTTLEPCSQRKHPKVPCAKRLADAGVAVVYIGSYDPNPVIHRQGWKILNQAGVRLRDFPTDLRDEIATDNALFLTRFKRMGGDQGEASFDFKLTGGIYPVHTAIGVFHLNVTERGGNSIYLYDETTKVGDPRFAGQFSDVDDPGALEFNARYVDLVIGGIACLRNTRGYLLVKLVNVDRTTGRSGVTFQWETRGVPKSAVSARDDG